MFVPAQFRGTVKDAQKLIRAYPLALLISSPMAVTHVPMLAVDGRSFQPVREGEMESVYEASELELWGHFAAANPHASLLRDAAAEHTAVFTGAEGYITPSYYEESKPRHGKVVPTYNYAAVEVTGRVRARLDAAEARRVIEVLVDAFEAPRDVPWKVDDAPDEYVALMMRAIVPFRMHVTKLVAKAKLSQNKGPRDLAGVVNGLERDGNIKLAEMVRESNGC